jgi:hypothetical protein
VTVAAIVDAAMVVLGVDVCAAWEAALAVDAGTTTLMTVTAVASTGTVTTRDHSVIRYRI